MYHFDHKKYAFTKGDVQGHAFHGNQFVSVEGAQMAQQREQQQAQQVREISAQRAANKERLAASMARLEQSKARIEEIKNDPKVRAFADRYGNKSTYLVHQDSYPGHEGWWRVTAIDEHGSPYGHVASQTYEAVLREAHFLGANIASEIDAFKVAKLATQQARDAQGRWVAENASTPDEHELAAKHHERKEMEHSRRNNLLAADVHTAAALLHRAAARTGRGEDSEAARRASAMAHVMEDYKTPQPIGPDRTDAEYRHDELFAWAKSVIVKYEGQPRDERGRFAGGASTAREIPPWVIAHGQEGNWENGRPKSKPKPEPVKEREPDEGDELENDFDAAENFIAAAKEAGEFVAFHGTAASLIKSILKEGLTVKAAKQHRNFEGAPVNLYEGYRGESIYLTRTEKVAKEWAAAADGVVLTVKIPAEHASKWQKDYESPHLGHDFTFTGDVRPEWIVEAKRHNGKTWESMPLRKAEGLTLYLVMFPDGQEPFDEEPEEKFAKYSPNQARDHGRFAAMPGEEGETPTGRANAMVSAGFASAALRHDDGRIMVTGTTHNEAGDLTALLDDGWNPGFLSFRGEFFTREEAMERFNVEDSYDQAAGMWRDAEAGEEGARTLHSGRVVAPRVLREMGEKALRDAGYRRNFDGHWTPGPKPKSRKKLDEPEVTKAVPYDDRWMAAYAAAKPTEHMDAADFHRSRARAFAQAGSSTADLHAACALMHDVAAAECHESATLAAQRSTLFTHLVENNVGARTERAEWEDSVLRSALEMGKYDAAQPRDESGRWASTGGAKLVQPEYAPRLPDETDKQYAKRVIDHTPVPEHLPDEPERYFNVTADTPMIEVANLRSTKSDEDNKSSGENGAKRMLAAYHGVLSRRDPITVEDAGDGTFRILDGNASYTAAKRYGWEKLPVQFADPKKLAKYSPDQPRDEGGHWTSAPERYASAQGQAERAGFEEERERPDPVQHHNDAVRHHNRLAEKEPIPAAKEAQREAAQAHSAASDAWQEYQFEAEKHPNSIMTREAKARLAALYDRANKLTQRAQFTSFRARHASEGLSDDEIGLVAKRARESLDRFLWDPSDLDFDGEDEEKFDESQPRDDHGRWTEGESGGARGESTKEDFSDTPPKIRPDYVSTKMPSRQKGEAEKDFSARFDEWLRNDVDSRKANEKGQREDREALRRWGEQRYIHRGPIPYEQIPKDASIHRVIRDRSPPEGVWNRQSDRLNAKALDTQTKADQAALDDYADKAYKTANGKLRKGDESAPIVRALDDAFTRAPVVSSGNVVVFRGVSSARIAGLKVGDEFGDKGFVSTSLSPDSAFHIAASKTGAAYEGGMTDERDPRPGTVVKISLPEGTHGLYVHEEKSKDPFVFNQREHEIVLNRGARFRVDSIRQGKDEWDGLTHTFMEVTYLGSTGTGDKLKKYSEDQPRDDHGRWTSDGEIDEGGAKPSGDVNYVPQFKSPSSAEKWAEKTLGVKALVMDRDHLPAFRMALQALVAAKASGMPMPDGVEVTEDMETDVAARVLINPGRGQTLLQVNAEEASPWDVAIAHRDHFLVASDPQGLIIHEVGHVAHWQSVLAKSDTAEEVIAKWAEYHEPMSKAETKIAHKVSYYAANTKTDFVAEVYTGLAHGEKYGDDVMKMYWKLSGPKAPALRAAA